MTSIHFLRKFGAQQSKIDYLICSTCALIDLTREEWHLKNNIGVTPRDIVNNVLENRMSSLRANKMTICRMKKKSSHFSLGVAGQRHAFSLDLSRSVHPLWWMKESILSLSLPRLETRKVVTKWIMCITGLVTLGVPWERPSRQIGISPSTRRL